MIAGRMRKPRPHRARERVRARGQAREQPRQRGRPGGQVHLCGALHAQQAPPRRAAAGAAGRAAGVRRGLAEQRLERARHRRRDPAGPPEGRR